MSQVGDTGAARTRILANIRTGLAVTGTESDRRAAVAARLKTHPGGLIPGRAKQPREALVRLFRELLEGQSATVVELPDIDAVPEAVADYLRGKNLGLSIRMGADPLWSGVAWDREPSLERKTGPAVGTDTAGLSHAVAGIAETGTLVLTSGPDNPTTLNFLPETHLVVVREADIVGPAEAVWDRLRAVHGEGRMPRAVNFVSGPSRTADIEQQLVMGAHGPRRMLVMIVTDHTSGD